MFCKVLEELDWPLFQKLILPVVGKTINKEKNFHDYIMVGSFNQFEICGLVACKKKDQELQIESIYLKESYRQKGTGKMMMKCLQEHAKSIGIKSIYFRFIENLESINAIKKMLISDGYLQSMEDTYFSFFKNDDVQRSRVSNKVFKNFKDYQLFNLLDFEARDLWNYQQIVTKKNFPLALGVHQYDFPIEGSCSYAIRKNDVICGWCLCHRIDKNHVRLTSLFLDEGHHSLIAFKLLNATLRSFTQITEKPELVVCTCSSFDKMDKIVRGTLSEYAYQVYQTNLTYKRL